LATAAPVLEFDWRRPQTFLGLAMDVATRPRAFFAAMPAGGSLIPPLAFLVLAQLIPALVQALAQLPQHGPAALAGMLVFLLKRLIYFLIFADLIWLMARFVSRAELSFTGALKIFCYSSGLWIVSAAVSVLSLAPAALIIVLLVLYHLYLIQVGLQVVAKLPTFQAMLAVLLAIVGFMVLWVFLAPMLGLMPEGAMPAGIPPDAAPGGPRP